MDKEQARIEEQKEIMQPVDHILPINARLSSIGDKLTDERAQLEEEIKKTDAQIDDLVYKIYGITDEERKVIEGALK